MPTVEEVEAQAKATAEARGHVVKGQVESNTEIPLLAFGVFKDIKTGEWKVAKVAYNPETGAAEIVERIHTGGYRALANEQFKIEVAKTLLI